MKVCKRCKEELNDNINFCPRCGENQYEESLYKEKSSSTFLIVLCILTIVGSVFTIGRAILYEMFTMISNNNDYYRGWFYAGSAIGTLAGAIVMINRKIVGLYIYTFFQLVYITTVFLAAFSHSSHDSGDNLVNSATDYITAAVTIFFLVPALTFLILYWTKMIRKHLN